MTPLRMWRLIMPWPLQTAVPAEQAKMQSNPVFAGADDEVSIVCDCRVHGLHYLSGWLSHHV